MKFLQHIRSITLERKQIMVNNKRENDIKKKKKTFTIYHVETKIAYQE